MNSAVAILSPLALLLPAMLGDVPAALPQDTEIVGAAPESDVPAAGLEGVAAPVRVLEQAQQPPVVNQVRIEERVIIRIGPSSPRAFEQSMENLARKAESYKEEKIGDCVAIGAIRAVYPSKENRLLLFMRDRRVLSASLERTCHAEDFYSGFYVERSEDGQLCARRDKLQSRAGASCRMSRLNRLVAERD